MPSRWGTIDDGDTGLMTLCAEIACEERAFELLSVSSSGNRYNLRTNRQVRVEVLDLDDDHDRREGTSAASGPQRTRDAQNLQTGRFEDLN